MDVSKLATAVLTPVVVLAAAAALAACAGSTATDAEDARTASAVVRARATGSSPAPWSGACGRRRGSVPIQHVIWVWFENKRIEEIVGRPGSSAAHENPFLNRVVGRSCTTLTRFTAEQHPSLGNYIAAATGSTAGLQGDCSPAQCMVDRDSVFGQVRRSGRAWRSFPEGAPRRCTDHDVGRYAVRHDPLPYLTREAADCRRWDQPLGSIETGPFARQLDAGTLAALTFVTPDLCNDSHDCRASTADAWLRRWATRIVSSPAYRRGDVALLLVWDEGNGDGRDGLPSATCPVHTLRSDCRAPGFVIAPNAPRGRRTAAPVDHYTLLQLTQELLGLTPRLGPDRSGDVAGLRGALGWNRATA